MGPCVNKMQASNAKVTGLAPEKGRNMEKALIAQGPVDRRVSPLTAENGYGLKTRKAKAHEHWMAPDDELRDPKGFCGWPRCKYLAYTPGDANHAELLCGGGQTAEKAISNAIKRIERIGVAELERQRVEKMANA